MSSLYTKVKKELCQLVALHPLHSIRKRVSDQIRVGTDGECHIPFPHEGQRAELDHLVDQFQSGVSAFDDEYTLSIRTQLETIKHFGDDESRSKSREAISAVKQSTLPRFNTEVGRIADQVVDECEVSIRKSTRVLIGQRIECSLKWRRTLLDADYLDRRIESAMRTKHQVRIEILDPVLT